MMRIPLDDWSIARGMAISNVNDNYYLNLTLGIGMPPIVSLGTLLSDCNPVFEVIRSGTHPNCGFKGGVAGMKPSGHSGGHSLPGIHLFGSTPGGALD
jgi:hypothetical protein